MGKIQVKSIYIVVILLLSSLLCLNLNNVAADNQNDDNQSDGQTLYVAVTGNDNNPGTLTKPLRTIQKAANIATPETTVLVRGGVYNERININVSGSEQGGKIIFQNFDSDRPIIDGSGLSVPDRPNGLFYIENRNHIVIKGFDLRNYRTSDPDLTPAGIYITGASTNIEIRNNLIHDLGTTFRGEGGNAFGIVVYGTEAPNSANNIIIDGNRLFKLKLGFSESLVLNGNVENFQITNNTVHDNNNIGIDIIGFEGTCRNPAFDQARNGIIKGNRVYNISSALNPAYAGDISADGIYVDGGKDVIIERNIVHNNDIGIELASEHAGEFTSNIIVRNNLIYRNNVVGISIGGFDEERGGTSECKILNNTLFFNDRLRTGTGEVNIQFNVVNNIFKNNILYAGNQSIFISNEYSENFGSDFDHNIYFSNNPEESFWLWKQVEYFSFAAYQRGTGNERNSRFTDPGFATVTLPFLHLLPSSAAIDAGVVVDGISTVDFDNQSRVQGDSIDIGADEAK